MEVRLPFYLLVLCSLSRGTSGEQCDVLRYEEPVATFRVDYGTSSVCTSAGAKTSYKVLNSTFGEISITVVTDRSLEVGEYIFELSADGCGDAALHTRRRFAICANGCSNAVGVINPCANEFSFNVTYAYQASYCVTLKHANKSEIWTSETFNVTTNYTQILITPETKPRLLQGACVAKQMRNHLEVITHTNESMFARPPIVKVFLAHPSQVDAFEPKTSGNFCHPNYTRRCAQSKNHNHSCVYEVTPGKYKVLALLEDPRCSDDLCFFFNDCELKASVSSPKSLTERIVMVTIPLTAICVCLTFWVVKKFRSNKASRQRNPANAHYELQRINERNEYLVVYARESELFERVVGKLKQLLVSGERSQKVTTLYELDDRKCVDPKRWLENKLCDENVKIILLLSVCSVYARDSKYAYKSPHCLDYLFPYALKLLQSYTKRSYDNLYKVVIAEERPAGFQFLNSLTEYSLPQHTVHLLHSLGVNVEESNRCVRELRDECRSYCDHIAKNNQYLQDIFRVTQ